MGDGTESTDRHGNVSIIRGFDNPRVINSLVIYNRVIGLGFRVRVSYGAVSNSRIIEPSDYRSLGLSIHNHRHTFDGERLRESLSSVIDLL